MISDEIKESKLVGFYRASRGSRNPPDVLVGRGSASIPCIMPTYLCHHSGWPGHSRGLQHTPSLSFGHPAAGWTGRRSGWRRRSGDPRRGMPAAARGLGAPVEPEAKAARAGMHGSPSQPPLGFQFRTPAAAEGSEGPRASPSRRPGATR